MHPARELLARRGAHAGALHARLPRRGRHRDHQRRRRRRLHDDDRRGPGRGAQARSLEHAAAARHHRSRAYARRDVDDRRPGALRHLRVGGAGADRRARPREPRAHHRRAAAARRQDPDGARAPAVAAPARHERAPARPARRQRSGERRAGPALMHARVARVLVLVVVLAAVAAFFLSGAHRYLSFEALKTEQARIDAGYRAHPAATVGAFFLLYVAITGLSIPGATVLTLIAGALFGLIGGTLLVSFAAACGATVALLVSRYVLRDWVRRRFARELERVDQGI